MTAPADTRSALRASTTPAVAIVGAGASGTLLAAQLLRRHHRAGLRVILIERRNETGRGVAYSTPYDYHRLNVPAEQMGALPRDPRHFVRWASSEGHGTAAGDFAPRGLYGDYLRALLADAERTSVPEASLEIVRDDVVDATVDEQRRCARLELRSGGSLEVDRVVLALGNLAPADPPGAEPGLLRSGLYEADPWDPELAERAAGDDLVLLLGTGLTMVDVALTLGAETVRPRFLAISRKGLMPQQHRPGASGPPRQFQLARERVRLDEIASEVEAEASAVESKGGDWRQVIDSLRPVTNQIWHRFSDADRRAFVARLARRWDVHRHRMAPEVAVMLEELKESGRLELAMASVASLRAAPGGGVDVELERDGTRIEKLTVSRVVNCTGPALDLRAAREPLLEALFAAGEIRSGPLRLGLDHDPRGVIIRGSGSASGVLHCLGPMRKGRLWETTAIPEIRTQAFELADQITSDLERAAARRAPALAD